MTTAKTMQGKCLCGAVTMTTKATTEVEACHCGMCRRWGGGPLIAIHCGDDVKIEGSDHVSAFNSSMWAERAFCKTCGTHLYYKLKQASEFIVPAGLFQDQQGFELKEQIFIDKKPSYYEFSNKTRVMTEAEVFEKYTPK